MTNYPVDQIKFYLLRVITLFSWTNIDIRSDEIPIRLQNQCKWNREGQRIQRNRSPRMYGEGTWKLIFFNRHSVKRRDRFGPSNRTKSGISLKLSTRRELCADHLLCVAPFFSITAPPPPFPPKKQLISNQSRCVIRTTGRGPRVSPRCNLIVMMAAHESVSGWLIKRNYSYRVRKCLAAIDADIMRLVSKFQ